MTISSVLVAVTIIGCLPFPIWGKVDSGSNSKELTRIPKQIQTNPTVVNTENDHKPEETGMFGADAAALGHGKYFQDAFTHLFGPLQIEFGHIKETPEDWEQRYEKKDDKNKRYQGKVRWGDKHGGYGEHYWDYNHAGHDHGGSNDEESHDENEGDDGDYSHNIPEYVVPSDKTLSTFKQAPNTDGTTTSEDRVKRHPVNGNQNLKPSAVSKVADGPISLVYDVETGTVINEATGQSYILQPVN
ncbi:uncharacterized protein LOC142331690 [Lycorma delicatula]|uniref:uncharacterized protein LOC142331690 n=1 Tax=Lycorma delicatula TaxID=130591 RepID=UPI003F517B92